MFRVLQSSVWTSPLNRVGLSKRACVIHSSEWTRIRAGQQCARRKGFYCTREGDQCPLQVHWGVPAPCRPLSRLIKLSLHPGDHWPTHSHTTKSLHFYKSIRILQARWPNHCCNGRACRFVGCWSYTPHSVTESLQKGDRTITVLLPTYHWHIQCKKCTLITNHCDISHDVYIINSWDDDIK